MDPCVIVPDIQYIRTGGLKASDELLAGIFEKVRMEADAS